MATSEITVTFIEERIAFETAHICVVEHVDGPLHPELKGLKQFAAKGSKTLRGGDSFQYGQTYRLLGNWSNYTNRRTGRSEWQFQYSSAVVAEPLSKRGIVRYLIKLGRGRGIGSTLAERAWETFGSKTLEAWRNSPELISQRVNGISQVVAEQMSDKLKEMVATEAATVELTGLLSSKGFPKTTAEAALKEWGNTAIEIIKSNPYQLMIFKGCGFLLCDKLYLELRLPRDAIERQALCVWFSLASDTNGNTWRDNREVMYECQSRIGSGFDFREAIIHATKEEMIDRIRVDGDKIVDSGGTLMLSQLTRSQSEQRILDYVLENEDLLPRWPAAEEISADTPSLTYHQLEEYEEATQSRLSILGGGPGTGKTFLSAAIVRSLEKAGGELAACAPTGKAAVRLSEVMRSYGLKTRARTIHRLLGVDKTTDNKQRREQVTRFLHNSRNPLPYEWIIVDESSMIDNPLFAALLSACAAGTHILFVGDVHQLPPVNYGVPLLNLITSGVSYGELTEVQRNSGRIVGACHEIRERNRFDVSRQFDPDLGENLVCLPAQSTDESMSQIESIYDDLARESDIDTIWDVQVICAVNEKSGLSRKELNPKLQAKLNLTVSEEGADYRLNDKVVCNKNQYFMAARRESGTYVRDDDLEVYIANGEQGRIVELGKKHMIVDTADGLAMVFLDKGRNRYFDLAYAISCHKSQGAEWPYVIVVLDPYPGAKMVCDRNWIYTAMSRAKTGCFLVGNMTTALQFCNNQKVAKRRTLLVERMNYEKSVLMLAEM